ncbi:DUF7344 domain-containing protein [Halobaculum gomorrense]|uniref:DUF7344 domain-containing protein n=1 Tax=Halobaculum gomorrense TaxID=43928 RepID=A0A1M5NR27_9EURY|nr:hypothetical protein [Halobaculum gomorrense]SHG92064.1 hypothetical protein SAMN05443636_1323 [Halobaculum gomorrense]
MTGDNSDLNGESSGNTTPASALLALRSVCPEYVFDALAVRRRRILRRVLDEGRARGLKRLAMNIAVGAGAGSGHEVTDSEWETVYTSLSNQHGPKLASLNIVAFDRDADRVVPAEGFAPVDAALEAVDITLGGAVHAGGIDG